MQTVSSILNDVRDYLHSKEFIASSRTGEKDFTRNCILTCPNLVVLILSLLRRSLICEVFSFTKTTKINLFCRSAVTKARAKLLPEAFFRLNNYLTNKIYSKNNLKYWNSFIVAAVDGTTYQLPTNSPVLNNY